MTLSEIAIEAYKKKKAEQDKNTEKEGEDFSKGALEALKEQFGDIDISKVEIVEKRPGSTTIMIENIVMMITRKQGYHHFRMIKKCEKCSAEYYSDDIRKIEDIGKFLLDEHNKMDCDNNLKMKSGAVEQTTEEKLITALREFVLESQI